jgi:uncharacterized integral membrane protein
MGFKSARTGRDSKRKFKSCTLANVLPCSFGVLFVSLLMAILSLVIFAEGNTAAQQWEGVNVYHWLLLPLILVVLGVGGTRSPDHPDPLASPLILSPTPRHDG